VGITIQIYIALGLVFKNKTGMTSTASICQVENSYGHRCNAMSITVAIAVRMRYTVTATVYTAAFECFLLWPSHV
jgi:hypothetical protein